MHPFGAIGLVHRPRDFSHPGARARMASARDTTMRGSWASTQRLRCAKCLPARVAQRVANGVHRQHCEQYQQPGIQCEPRVRREIRLRAAQHVAP